MREAVTELIGTYIVHSPEFGSFYFGDICNRLEDIGKSVRKRSIKILREICGQSFSGPTDGRQRRISLGLRSDSQRPSTHVSAG